MAPFDEEPEPGPDLREAGTYCQLCGATGRWLHLVKCPMCHKQVCDNCGHKFGGKDFCSRHCANEFYWGGDDADAD